MTDQLTSAKLKRPSAWRRHATGLAVAVQVSGCALPNLAGRDLDPDERKEVKAFISEEPVCREIVNGLVEKSDVELADVWGGTVMSTDEIVDDFEQEIGNRLKTMFKEGRIRVYSGKKFMAGVKEDSDAFFTDTPLSSNPDDGFIFLNEDERSNWGTSILVHEALHATYGSHSDAVDDFKAKAEKGEDSPGEKETAEFVIEKGDIPYEIQMLYMVAERSIEQDENKEYETFLETDWSENPNLVFDYLESEEGQSQEEWARSIASSTYSVSSNILGPFGVSRDELTEILANSPAAWEAHQELLAEIRLEVESEYLSEARQELEAASEVDYERIDESIEEENVGEEFGTEHPEVNFDGYRIKRG